MSDRAPLTDLADRRVLNDFVWRIRQIGRECGYAIAIHGSEQRDLDLIAAPWTPEAVSADQLIARLCEEVPLHERVVNVYEDGSVSTNPEPKPWGRWAWSLSGCPKPWKYIDLSVVPRAGEPVPLLTYATVKQRVCDYPELT